ncbi:uncharacterized protein LOC123654297 [Melitaea cinxia]|uniref:uncharacterized protein LOC123654297 n=1 Tax=Melitaea cinxia TaxID=113334 RepID=UPI001E2700F9|nr:uncharacterized protein LOC123654297 [Melitaea cinxia]XP_045446168.1 uncharacterized protein LOC123654297 [Melitaea cinxia]
MKHISTEKSKKNGYQSDDDNVRYKINKEYFNGKQSPKTVKRPDIIDVDDENVRYKFPTTLSASKSKLIERKPKSKPKIKVNFWSNKQAVRRLNKAEDKEVSSNRRHTVGGSINELTAKPKTSTVKVRKRVSFLPSPLFLDNHVPMVTVPDDLTIQLNEEEANDLGEDLNHAFINSQREEIKSNDNSKRKGRSSTTTQASPKLAKRKRSSDDSELRSQGNENELEFFSKYVVQKLRRMETNQRIYSENLINTVLMLGQLGKLNGKSKINEV